MPDRNIHFLGYRCKVDEENNIYYAYGSDKETNHVQVYLAPWKYPYWYAIPPKQIEEILLDEAQASIDPRTDLMPNANAIPPPPEAPSSAVPSRRQHDSLLMPRMDRGS